MSIEIVSIKKQIKTIIGNIENISETIEGYQLVIDGELLDYEFLTEESAQQASQNVIDKRLPVGHPYQVGSEWYYYTHRKNLNKIVKVTVTNVVPWHTWEEDDDEVYHLYLGNIISWVDKYGEDYSARTAYGNDVTEILRKNIEDFIDA